MSTLNTVRFESEAAREFLYELTNFAGPELLGEGLEFVAGADEMIFIEAPVAVRALVAAELVAAARGQPATDLPEEAAAWVVEHDEAFTPELAATAVRAVERIATASELKEQWDATDAAEAWQESLRGLQVRLGAV